MVSTTCTHTSGRRSCTAGRGGSRRQRSLAGLLAAGLIASVGIAVPTTVPGETEVFVASQYFPLVSGNQWTYSSGTTSTVLDGSFDVRGVVTKAVQNTFPAVVAYYSNDAEGLRLHQQQGTEFVTGVGNVTIFATFVPPLQIAASEANIGDTVFSSGRVEYEAGAAGSFTLSYTATSMILAPQTINVPAGEYRAFPLSTTVDMFGSIYGMSVDESETDTVHFAKLIGAVKERAEVSGTALGAQIIEFELTSTNVEPPLYAAVLPSSRSVLVGTPATAFATIINPSGARATGCTIAPITALPASFEFVTTDKETNLPTGTTNAAVDIAPLDWQSFVYALTPANEIFPTDVEFRFGCLNTKTAETIAGLNTLLLSASPNPIPDIVALAVTPTNDGIVVVPRNGDSGVFAVASVNMGATAEMTVSADTGSVTLPIRINLCETDPETSVCLNPGQPTTVPVTTTVASGETPTFALFVSASESVSFYPEAHRIFVRFEDGAGVTRGSTSVAVMTTP